MTINELVKMLGGTSAEIAKGAGISQAQLRNMKASKQEMVELKQGGWVVKRKGMRIFGGKNGS